MPVCTGGESTGQTTKGEDVNGRRIAALSIAVLALVAAGCGGSSNNEASSDTDTTATIQTTPNTETETSTEGSTLTETDTGDTGEVALGGKCAELAQLGAKLSQSMTGQTGDLESASKLFDEIAGQVPDEIKGDYEVIAKNFKKIAEAFKGVNLQSGQAPSADQAAKLQQVLASIDNAEVQKATQHIEAWAKANC